MIQLCTDVIGWLPFERGLSRFDEQKQVDGKKQGGKSKLT